MQFLNTAVIVALASIVAADQTFSLTAQGDDVNEAVKLGDDGYLYLGSGSDATFTLEEPSGYLSVDGQKIGLEGGLHTASQEQASKDFGVEDGKLRTGPSIDKFDFYACPKDDVYTLQSYTCDGGKSVSLVVDGASEPSSSSSAAPSSSVAPTSEAPSSSAAPTSEAPTSSESSEITSAPATSKGDVETVTTFSTAISTLPCEEECHHNSTSSEVPIYSSDNAAGRLSYGAGALVVAGMALL